MTLERWGPGIWVSTASHAALIAAFLAFARHGFAGPEMGISVEVISARQLDESLLAKTPGDPAHDEPASRAQAVAKGLQSRIPMSLKRGVRQGRV